MKTIKVIDLLNMIANKEYNRLPKTVEYSSQKFYLETQIMKADGVAVAKECNYQNSMGSCIMCYFNRVSCLNSELKIIEEQILDDKEREYLSYVIRPFRDRVKFISKAPDYINDKEYIYIATGEAVGTFLPPFKAGTMYKNMELETGYTFEELGL